MKFEEETKCTVKRVYLDEEEYETLKHANIIIDRIWGKLDKADDVDGTAHTVYNAIDNMGDSLETIMGNVCTEQSV